MKFRIPFLPHPPRVNVIRLQGAISTGARGLSDAAMAPLIERAFSRGKPVAVALQINSPGGSPVQSALIAARISSFNARASPAIRRAQSSTRNPSGVSP